MAKVTAPKKKAVKKELPDPDKLIFKKATKESYDGEKTKRSSLDECCEKVPVGYDQDAELMMSASYEIKNLREQNRRMSTRLEMFDKMYSLFTADGGRRDGTCSSGNDIARNLEYRAEHRRSQASAEALSPKNQA